MHRYNGDIYIPVVHTCIFTIHLDYFLKLVLIILKDVTRTTDNVRGSRKRHSIMSMIMNQFILLT